MIGLRDDLYFVAVTCSPQQRQPGHVPGGSSHVPSTKSCSYSEDKRRHNSLHPDGSVHVTCCWLQRCHAMRATICQHQYNQQLAVFNMTLTQPVV
jgi:hypothetical protein